MAYDLDKTISFGRKIGAKVAIVMNGRLRNYYKPGDAASKYCLYTYTQHNNGRPLRWEATSEFSYKRIVDFYRNLKHTIEVIQIPEPDHDNRPDPDSEG